MAEADGRLQRLRRPAVTSVSGDDDEPLRDGKEGEGRGCDGERERRVGGE